MFRIGKHKTEERRLIDVGHEKEHAQIKLINFWPKNVFVWSFLELLDIDPILPIWKKKFGRQLGAILEELGYPNQILENLLILRYCYFNSAPTNQWK